tara:strand:- start:330 stop:608 length:279 start_codon:yes stop_codon:yes gene_type:complete
MKDLETVIREVVDAKAEQDNQVDLNAYENGIRAFAEAINYSQCYTQLPDGMIQIDNAYVEDADDVGSYYVDGRYTKVFVLENEFENNKCIKN